MKVSFAFLALISASAFAAPAFAQEQQAQPAAQAQPGAPAQATAADLTVGAQVIGSDGQVVGTIEEADATGAVLNTGTVRGRLALDAFYKDQRGLLIGYSRAELEAAAAPAQAPAAQAQAADTAAPAAASGSHHH